MSLRIMHATVLKVLTVTWEATFGEPLSNESLRKITSLHTESTGKDHSPELVF